MKTTHIPILPLIALVLLAAWQQPSFANSEKEKYLTQMLTKDPNSEQFRYEYADYLYQNEKFDLALTHVGYVLQINPGNSKAKRLKGYIEEVRTISDTKVRKKKMMDYAMADMSEVVGDLKKMSDDLQGSLAPGVIDKHQAEKTDRQKVLDQKFRISQSADSCDSFEKVTLDFEMTGIKYRAKGMKEEAMKTYRNGIEKKDTAKLRLGIISILFSDGRYAEASEEVAKASSKFPRDIRFQLYREGLDKIKSIVSSEGKKTAQAATSENISDAEEILRDACRKVKK
jgi:tetratricopeptide (TPR) repeat protein